MLKWPILTFAGCASRHEARWQFGTYLTNSSMSSARNRTSPLPLLLCCGVAAGLVASEASAQSMTPLRVDPTLLGLPPLEKSTPKPVEQSRSEVKTVEPANIEAKPLDSAADTADTKAVPARRKSSKASADQIPSRAVASESQQPAAVAVPAPQPAPVQSSAPAVVPPAPRPRETERATANAASPGATTAPPARSSTRPRRPDWAAPVVEGGAAATAAPAAEKPGWFARAWSPVQNAWDRGNAELYLPLVTYHVRSNYTPEQIAHYQERPPGFGLGRGYYNERGNWEGIYLMGFQDSHFKPEYHLGYGWKSIWRPAEDVRLGLGFTAFVFTREDILHYKPLPGVLPLASVSYKNFSLEGSYVPGSQVFFMYAKWEFGKSGEKVGTPMRPAEPSEPPPGAAGQPPVVGAPRQAAGAVAGSYGPASSGGVAKPAVSAPVGVGTPAGNVTTLTALRVHPGLLGLEAPEAPALAGTPARGGGGGAMASASTGTAAVASTPAASLASLERSQQERWRAGTAPVLSFPTEPGVLEDDGGGSPALRTAKSLTPLLSSELPRPMFLAADSLSGINDHETVAEGDVEARKGGIVVNADRMTYWPVEDELEATGDVVMTKGDDFIAGPRMRMKMEAQTGTFDQPAYFLRRESKFAKMEQDRQKNSFASTLYSDQAQASSPAFNALGALSANQPPLPMTESHGQAERIDFEGENKLRIFNGNYTTCKPDNVGWYVKTDELALDYDREVADGKGGVLYFQDTPIFWSPWVSFSLNNQRKSGFLAPTIGTTSTSGLMLSAPYYWNIAPNMDAVIASRVFSRRGLQVAGEFRHLDYYSNTQARVEVMPHDIVKNDSRYGYSLQHQQVFGRGFSGTLNLSGVSDDTYFTDISSRSTITSQTQLLRQGVFAYGNDWLTANVIGQSYQTLQPDPANPVVKPYSYAPQVNVNARLPDFYRTDLAFLGQYTAFEHATLDKGSRMVAYPQLSLPFVQPGWYVTPKIGAHLTNYSLERRVSTGPDSVSRALPIASVDAGMTFEREVNWLGSKGAIQTLEPRLYYLNVPYKDQSNIPIFDSGLADFNFAQIFSENQYAGYDRVADANQLTAALTSRLIDPATGGEYMRGMIGQRYYFRNQSTTLPSQTLSSWNKSDLLAAFSGRLWPKSWLDAAIQYSPQNTQVERFSIGTRYQPELGKVLNFSYRYNRDSANLPLYTASGLPDPNSLKNIDISGQWPIWGGWSAVGRYNYSLKERQPVETLGGLEYNAGCWAIRVVGHQLATVSGKTNTSLFVQLELNDFARIGSNPAELLRRNIQGFGLMNQPAADPIFGD